MRTLIVKQRKPSSTSSSNGNLNKGHLKGCQKVYSFFVMNVLVVGTFLNNRNTRLIYLNSGDSKI